MNKVIDYTIISKPAYVQFECPHCHEDVEIPFDKVDYKTDYWGDGAWCDCPSCGEEVELGDIIQTDVGGNTKVTINGDVNKIDCSGSVEVHGNSGSIDCGGSCTVDGSVNGNIDCGGSIECGNVSGDIDAGGSVRRKR